MAMPPHLRFARPPGEAAERIAVGLLVVYTASTPESNEAWQITTNHYEEQDRSFGSNMSTAERDVLFPLSSPGTSAGGYEAAYNATLEDARLRERSNFKTGERSRSHALRRSERKPGGGAKVRYARSACVVPYCGILPTDHPAATCCSRSWQPSA
jgi:hypothetical protein